VLDDLKVSINGPMQLLCDNQSAISITHNLVQHDCTKHVKIDSHFIKEKIEAKVICIPFISSKNQLADLLTKGLPIKRFEELTSNVGMMDIHSPA